MNLTHGMSRSSTYNIWCAMKARCLNEKDSHYHLYGGRGITVCAKWLTFEGFFEDMGVRPDGLTLERKNGNEGYNAENCVWATRKEQGANTSRVKFTDAQRNAIATDDRQAAEVAAEYGTTIHYVYHVRYKWRKLQKVGQS